MSLVEEPVFQVRHSPPDSVNALVYGHTGNVPVVLMRMVISPEESVM